jgi:enterochelin esterase-like enzyme
VNPRKLLIKLVAATLLLAVASALAAGKLSSTTRIDSEALGYALQYWVYLPDVPADRAELPTIYLTDGQWYLSEGRMIDVLDGEIAAGNIEPVVAVFVDSRDPDDLSHNRRNDQFMCSQAYVAFFVNELVPAISRSFPVSLDPPDRVIGGLSFGGLNAACFGLMASNHFGGIAMQSPASDKHLKVVERLYRENDRMPVKMFFSVGTRRDNTRAARKFHGALVELGYDVTYIEVPQGHNWGNWQPLLDDMLQAFFQSAP